ncbi:hypothetical protein TNCV_2398801 [Trichonephila clavipes]|uniref:Uncharacterized protein n=1 Tax=Trichonephila clavipes TaxID=2585209 RepID=A0A8X6SVN3_TRICX|nr:hypothetical protein TNCV_2398801 [Trichonephila clavipes]
MDVKLFLYTQNSPNVLMYFYDMMLSEKTLQPPYDGPFAAVKRFEKLISLQRQGKEICVSIVRVKPTFMMSDTIKSNQPSFIPKSKEVPATQTTRSGHRVHFPQKYVST